MIQLYIIIAVILVGYFLMWQAGMAHQKKITRKKINKQYPLTEKECFKNEEITMMDLNADPEIMKFQVGGNGGHSIITFPYIDFEESRTKGFVYPFFEEKERSRVLKHIILNCVRDYSRLLKAGITLAASEPIFQETEPVNKERYRIIVELQGKEGYETRIIGFPDTVTDIIEVVGRPEKYANTSSRMLSIHGKYLNRIHVDRILLTGRKLEDGKMVTASRNIRYEQLPMKGFVRDFSSVNIGDKVTIQMNDRVKYNDFWERQVEEIKRRKLELNCELESYNEVGAVYNKEEHFYTQAADLGTVMRFVPKKNG